MTVKPPFRASLSISGFVRKLSSRKRSLLAHGQFNQNWILFMNMDWGLDLLSTGGDNSKLSLHKGSKPMPVSTILFNCAMSWRIKQCPFPWCSHFYNPLCWNQFARPETQIFQSLRCHVTSHDDVSEEVRSFAHHNYPYSSTLRDTYYSWAASTILHCFNSLLKN